MENSQRDSGTRIDHGKDSVLHYKLERRPLEMLRSNIVFIDTEMISLLGENGF